MIGLKRNNKEIIKKSTKTKKYIDNAFMSATTQTRFNAISLSIRSFMVGSLLSITGCSALVYSFCYVTDVYTVQDFYQWSRPYANRMMEYGKYSSKTSQINILDQDLSDDNDEKHIEITKKLENFIHEMLEEEEEKDEGEL